MAMVRMVPKLKQSSGEVAKDSTSIANIRSGQPEHLVEGTGGCVTERALRVDRGSTATQSPNGSDCLCTSQAEFLHSSFSFTPLDTHIRSLAQLTHPSPFHLVLLLSVTAAVWQSKRSAESRGKWLYSCDSRA
jgi:hypothetical protein